MSIEKIIQDLAMQIHKIADVKGFHEDYYNTLKILSDGDDLSDEIIETLKWFDSTAEQAEISRMHSELSEWTEAVRHDNPPDQHLPHLSSAEVEAADCIIRILDTCAKRKYNIGKALVDKMEYNRTRPYKHGKNS